MDENSDISKEEQWKIKHLKKMTLQLCQDSLFFFLLWEKVSSQSQLSYFCFVFFCWVNWKVLSLLK